MSENGRQPYLPEFELDKEKQFTRTRTNGQMNKLDLHDQPFHDWYRFVLSFPPHLVRTYIQEFGIKNTNIILDPFCGTGTTIIESKLNGIQAVGIEANYFAHFASSVKTNWEINPDELNHARLKIVAAAKRKINANSFPSLKTLPSNRQKLLIKNSISPIPLHKSLCLLEEINQYDGEPFYGHLLLAFANALVFSISNLKFGPEVGVGNIKNDAPVVESWNCEINKIYRDIISINPNNYPESQVILGDARDLNILLSSNSIDAIITSPPYPNEKDYSRTTRLETVMLGFVDDLMDLRKMKKTFIRSNTRGVYKEDADRIYVRENEQIQGLVEKIENRRVQLGKTSGFEKLYPKVTEEYFGGLARHLISLRDFLNPGAKLAYVVGDQASYLKVMIRTGQILANIATDLGYKLDRIDLFRTRYATSTKEQLREEVVVFTWPG